MKRGLAYILVALLSASFVFAEGSFVVKSVKGKVKYESAPGTMSEIKAGQTITASTLVDIGLSSNIVITVNGKDVKIAGIKKGALEKFLPAGAANGPVANTVGGKASGKSSVSTASSRAQDVKSEDFDWGGNEEATVEAIVEEVK